MSLHFLILARILVSQFSHNPSSLIADHPQYLIVFLISYYPPSESDHLGLPSARILNRNLTVRFLGFPGGSDGKESDCNARDMGSIPGLGRSLGEGNGNPLQSPVFLEILLVFWGRTAVGLGEEDAGGGAEGLPPLPRCHGTCLWSS